MQRKFLEELELTKEVIDKIMDENGNDIEREKGIAQTQIDDLTGQLTTAKDTLKSFEGVDVGELKGEIEKLNGELATQDTNYQAKIAEMVFSSTLDNSLSSFKARDLKAVKALLDVDALKASKNQEADIKAQIEGLKGEKGYLFESDTPAPTFAGKTEGATTPTGMDAIRAAAGLTNTQNTNN